MDWSESGYLALSALNVKDGYIDFSQDVHYGNQELYDKWMSGKELHRGQVLFTTEAPMGNVAQVPDNKGYILSQRTIAFDVEEKILSENFLATLLRTPNVFNDLIALSSGGTAKGVSQKSLSGLDVVIPKNIDEQNKLADYFINLDNLITLHQRKYLQKKKTSLTWEQRKLGDLVGIYDGVHQTPEYQDSGIMFLSVENIATLKSEKYISKEAFERDYKVYPEKGDILMTRIGDVGTTNVVETAKKVAFYVSLALLKPNGINSYFLSNAMKTNAFQKGLRERTLVTAIPQKINKDEIGKIDIFITNNDVEQQKIGAYFSTLDHLITLHQRKCDQMKELKKYMLTKMFPQNGAKVPEIRFDGFIDDWEQRKLDDWGTFYYGKSCPKWSVTEDSTTPCIRYGELYTKFGAKIDRVYSYTNMSPENLRFSKGTEVLIPRVGEDPMDYNHCTWLSMPNVAIGEMISVFNTDNNPLFTAMMFNATLQNEFAMRVEGGSVTNLYFEKLKSIEVSFPSIPEQEKIAAYFDSIDHLITLHQSKCENLKNLKEYLLRNMFV